ncbi:MAG: metal ABC transporter ATP-binding protein [Rickettsiales bacterium]
MSLEIHKGEILTIIGPNGGGKTTLAQIILGLLKPNSGKVERNENMTFTYMPQKLQHNKYLPVTVEDFLHLACNKKLGESFLERHKVKRLLKKQLADLSGGELQRVLFAKCIFTDADVLVLDEPTQCLDVNGQQEFYLAINDLNKKFGKTIIMISHDLHIVMKSSDKVVCMNNHLCCSGTPEDIYKNKEYTKIFGKSAALFSHYEHHHDHEH